MAEPATEKGRRAKRSIVQSAADLFAQRGLVDTFIDDVLASCGMGKSQFYHYFADKDELIAEVVRFRSETLFRELYFEPLSAISTLTCLLRWMRQFAEMMVRANYTQGCPIGTLAMQLNQSETLLRGEINNVMDELHRSLHGVLGRIHEKGQLPKRVETGELATYLLGVFQGGLLLSRSYQDPTKLRTVLLQAEKHLKQLAV